MIFPKNLLNHWLDIDSKHIWHPYSSIPSNLTPEFVLNAKGVKIELAKYGWVIDAMSSWWAAIHGYNHPQLNQAIIDQLQNFSHIMFGGLTHSAVIKLTEKLIDITPAPLQKIFYSDSGSVAVEVAIKLARQYWQVQGKVEKTKLLTWRGGYYGDTFTPMSVCDPQVGMHSLWNTILPEAVFIPKPPKIMDKNYINTLTTVITANAKKLAAVIIEPFFQGASSMDYHHIEYVRILKDVCIANEVLLIFDEIATGFGRTGNLFVADYAQIAPDIMCIGKALTGGYLTFAATLCTELISNTISAHPPFAFMHGPTFMANPLACAVANASIDILLTSNWKKNIQNINTQLNEGLKPLSNLTGVKDVRGVGAIGVVELNNSVSIPAATMAGLANGVWLRPFGNKIYTMPPYICTSEEIHQIITAIIAATKASLIDTKEF